MIFGSGYQLTKDKDLSLAGIFIAKERLTIRGPKGEIPHVALVSSLRERTQVEISKTDGRILGISPPVRLSGELDGTPGITLILEDKEFYIPESVIIPNRHIHMSVKDASKLGFKFKDSAIVVVRGERSLVFDHVLVRISELNDHTEMHIDYDEANAAGLRTEDKVQIFRINDKLIRLEQIINIMNEQNIEMLQGCLCKMAAAEKDMAKRDFLSDLINHMEDGLTTYED
ncbi:PduL/EutD family phosphate acyltransferase [Phosphitispora sp. TUW77]|uniref:PduL/EutD family phosphate acyltransferase n=1 Tax=Phosphitispora sp. TUW77 TaxID=3152361 RepID=UPI003AB3651C